MGLVAHTTPSGLRVVPVNYAVGNGAIYFRTTPDSELGVHAPGAEIAFAVQHIDYEHHRGWDVVARGTAKTVDDPKELEDLRRNWDPTPWADGTRSLCVRLRWTEISGRRLGPFPRSRELPVDRLLVGELRE